MRQQQLLNLRYALEFTHELCCHKKNAGTAWSLRMRAINLHHLAHSQEEKS